VVRFPAVTNVCAVLAVLALTGCFCFEHDHGRCRSDENCANDKGYEHCLFGLCQECAADAHCAAGKRCQRGRCIEQSANVLFKGGAFHDDKPSFTARDGPTLKANAETLDDVCQAPRDIVETCARVAPGCVPLPIPHAWSPCYGRGALCSEIYRERERERMLANPPQCFCSCGPEHAAAHARHEELMRDPAP
jgi:Cys-rich repeat protein